MSKAVGCEHCGDTGYHGRTTILELFILDDDMRKHVLEQADANSLQKMAVNKGMTTIYQDGLRKVLAGMTTLEEVTRVTQE